jgi:hypothetical protein
LFKSDDRKQKRKYTNESTFDRIKRSKEEKKKDGVFNNKNRDAFSPDVDNLFDLYRLMRSFCAFLQDSSIRFKQKQRERRTKNNSKKI